MAFFAEILGYKGIVVTDVVRKGQTKLGSLDGKSPYGHDQNPINVVKTGDLALNLMIRNGAQEATCDLEEWLQTLARGTRATVAIDAITVNTTRHLYPRVAKDKGIETLPIDHGPHPLRTIELGGIATFAEFGGVRTPLTVARMALHPPIPDQFHGQPALNIATLWSITE